MFEKKKVEIRKGCNAMFVHIYTIVRRGLFICIIQTLAILAHSSALSRFFPAIFFFFFAFCINRKSCRIARNVACFYAHSHFSRVSHTRAIYFCRCYSVCARLHPRVVTISGRDVVAVLTTTKPLLNIYIICSTTKIN